MTGSRGRMFTSRLIAFRCTVLFEDHRRGILTTRGLPKEWLSLCSLTFFAGRPLLFFRWLPHPACNSFRSRKPKSSPFSFCHSILAAILSSTPSWPSSSKKIASSFAKPSRSREWPAASVAAATAPISATVKRRATPTVWEIATRDQKTAARANVKAEDFWKRTNCRIRPCRTVTIDTIERHDWDGSALRSGRSCDGFVRQNGKWANRHRRPTNTLTRSPRYNKSNCIATSTGEQSRSLATRTALPDRTLSKLSDVDFLYAWWDVGGTLGLSHANLLPIPTCLLLEMIPPLRLWPLRLAPEQPLGGIRDLPCPVTEDLQIKVLFLFYFI